MRLFLFWHGICFYLSLLTTELGLIPPQGQTRLPDALNCQRLEKIVPRSDKAKLMVDPPRPPYLATLPSPGGLLFYLLVGPTSNHPGASGINQAANCIATRDLCIQFVVDSSGRKICRADC